MDHKHLIDLNDFPETELDSIIERALQISKAPEDYYGLCRGKILATLFYEPSTRTQMSFQSAMLKLGGKVIGFSDPQNTSVSKGESLKDTISVVSGYADIIAIRHPLEGSAKAASLYSNCPVINAGDGGHLHPTQTLTDLVTLSSEKRLDHLKIGLCGDLKNGRTVHSLVKALSRYPGNFFVLISTEELSVPQYIKRMLIKENIPFSEVLSLEEAIPELDVLYMTRIQRERFSSPAEYERQKSTYILDTKKLSRAKPDLKILHPLPRVDEIDYAIDEDERAIYFKQTLYGVYARMALILHLLETKEKKAVLPKKDASGKKCINPRCITSEEFYLPLSYSDIEGEIVCDYCEQQQ